MVARRDSAGGIGLAAVSVHSLAAELGLANTIARGLTVLVDAGLVDGAQGRATSGTFASGAYRLSVPSTSTRPCRGSSRRVVVRALPIALLVCLDPPLVSRKQRVLLGV